LPMANYQPYLIAGGTVFLAPNERVEGGGPLEYKPSDHPNEPVPTHNVVLVPHPRSFLEWLSDAGGKRPRKGD
jgi:hypothetical protein